MSLEVADMSIPIVSVIIPLYNHEQYISETIDSVLRQTFQDFELIIIDDGSIDRSAEVVKNIPDGRIRFFSQINQGAHNTINRGISLAKGKYVSILNSDDLYNAAWLAECVTALESDAALQAVFSYVEFINESGAMIRVSRGAEENWSRLETNASFQDENHPFLDLMTGNFLVTTSNIFCRRSVFDAIGVFSPLRYAHDYEFFLRLTYHYPVRIFEKAMVKYRIHAGNTIKENEAAVNFEVGLVLLSFFLRYDMKRFLPSGEKKFETLIKLFHSLNTLDADHMMVALLFYAVQYGEDKESLVSMLSEDAENIFRQECIRSFKCRIDAWHSSQQHALEIERNLADASKEAKKWWLKAQETEAELKAVRCRLTEMENLLWEKEAEADSIRSSFLFHVNSFFTQIIKSLSKKKQ